METKCTNGTWYAGGIKSLELTSGLPTLEVCCRPNDENTLPEWIAKVRGNSDEERLSNAKIMAASKDLLRALTDLTREVERMCSIGSDPLFMEMFKKRNNAVDAIIKATGEYSLRDTTE